MHINININNIYLYIIIYIYYTTCTPHSCIDFRTFVVYRTTVLYTQRRREVNIIRMYIISILYLLPTHPEKQTQTLPPKATPRLLLMNLLPFATDCIVFATLRFFCSKNQFDQQNKIFDPQRNLSKLEPY